MRKGLSALIAYLYILALTMFELERLKYSRAAAAFRFVCGLGGAKSDSAKRRYALLRHWPWSDTMAKDRSCHRVISDVQQLLPLFPQFWLLHALCPDYHDH